MSDAVPGLSTQRAPLHPLFPRPPRVDHNRPSLFELLAEDQLRELLHPVVHYVLTYLTHRYPRYLLRVLNHHEEFFALLLLVIERHHLKRHNASLSEHFYQMRVVPDEPIPTKRLSNVSPPRRRLLRRQRWGLLFFLVGVPYLRARAQDHYKRLGGGQDPESLPPDTIVPSTMFQRAFKRLYPFANLSFDLALLGYDLAYLFNRTNHYRPWHRLIGVHIERNDPDDLPLPSRLFDRLPPLLPPLLLLLKLSQWWYSPSSPRSIASESINPASYHTKILPPRPLPILPSSGILPLTPPPSPPASETTTSFTVTKESHGLCPLCGEKWKNPAVLPTGWVVCWKCGYDAVEGDEGDGKCPITGAPVGPGELRRVLV